MATTVNLCIGYIVVLLKEEKVMVMSHSQAWNAVWAS